MHNSKFWDAYDKNCWFYERIKLSYFTFKNRIQIARPKHHMTSARDVSLWVRDSSTFRLPYLRQNYPINWRNFSIQNHLTFSLPLNFSSTASCKQTWTHKLTSQRNKFGSSLLAVFEGKIAQFCALVKSIFIVGILKFWNCKFQTDYIFKLCRKHFRLISTLNEKFLYFHCIFFLAIEHTNWRHNAISSVPVSWPFLKVK